MRSAFSKPATIGKVAKTIGTAPRKPTQEIKTLLLNFTLKKAKLIKTLSGRATKIKNKAIAKPVKITGEFIAGNLGGGFGQVNEEEEPEVDLEIVDAAEADPQPTGAGTKTIALVPGAFKPPHQGHLLVNVNSGRM